MFIITWIGGAIASALGDKVVSFLSKYWKAIMFGAVSLSLIGYVAYLRWDRDSWADEAKGAVRAVSDASEANRAANLTIRELQQDALDARNAVEAAHERDELIDTTHNAIIQEIGHAPDDNAPAGPSFDALGDSLRSLDAGSGNKAVR